ncbi:MAG: TonB-dependent receptor plug domain-containing protein, partial [Siphonobacter aquaeclarae]|nr:TonB-dependent receptor plug domain-containing protein [Siphonobacter aquaeclarae]
MRLFCPPEAGPRARLLLLLCYFLGCLTSFGQQVTVSGRVTLSGSGEPAAGTSILVKGTNRGTQTDGNGNFTIPAEKTALLVFSRIGYQTQEIQVGNQTRIEVVLQESQVNLDQVVVVSYGMQRQRDITGSVQRISASELQDVPAAEFGQKLQGRVAGVQIGQVTGRPGQGMTFRIRGAASLGSGNQPLVVVDGQPIMGDFNLLNPDDIESFSVLKDASATALYGSRAANGVIIITTKQAKAGKTNITFNAYYGTQSVPQRGRPDLMNAREFAEFMNGFYQDKIQYEKWVNPATGLAEIPDDYKNPSQYGKGTDWYNA